MMIGSDAIVIAPNALPITMLGACRAPGMLARTGCGAILSLNFGFTTKGVGSSLDCAYSTNLLLQEHDAIE